MLTRRLEGLRRPAGAVGLGCVGMSAEYNTADIDDERSLAVLARAVELGVTLFDTADAYGPFTNESLLRRGLRGPGRDVVVATKVGLVMEPGGGPVPVEARRRADGRDWRRPALPAAVVVPLTRSASRADQGWMMSGSRGWPAAATDHELDKESAHDR